MRIRRAAVALAVTMSVMTGVAAAPAIAGVPLNGDTAYFRIDTGGVRGVSSVSEDMAEIILNFHLTGLKANHGYRIVGHGVPCGGGKEPVIGRDFTTNGKGSYWDPVRYLASADEVVSMRIKDRVTGKAVTCTNRTGFGPEATSIKLKGSGARAVVVVDESGSARVLLSVSGLVPSAGYRIVGRSGECGLGGSVTFNVPFTASTKGTALRDIEIDLGTAGVIDTGAVTIRRAGSGTVIACGAPVNAQ